MKSDLISKRALIKFIDKTVVPELLLHDNVSGAGVMAGLSKVLEETDVITTIDAVPVVHAENVTPTHSTDMFVCGNCGFTCKITKLIYEDEDHPEVGIPIAFEYDCKYCPDCGAKMDGGAEG